MHQSYIVQIMPMHDQKVDTKTIIFPDYDQANQRFEELLDTFSVSLVYREFEKPDPKGYQRVAIFQKPDTSSDKDYVELLLILQPMHAKRIDPKDIL